MITRDQAGFSVIHFFPDVPRQQQYHLFSFSSKVRPSVLFAGRRPDCQLLSLQPDALSLSQDGKPFQVQAEHSRLQPVWHGLRRICHCHGHGPRHAGGEHLYQAPFSSMQGPNSYLKLSSKRIQILPGMLFVVRNDLNLQSTPPCSEYRTAYHAR